jgi:hypothetical protein
LSALRKKELADIQETYQVEIAAGMALIENKKEQEKETKKSTSKILQYLKKIYKMNEDIADQQEKQEKKNENYTDSWLKNDKKIVKSVEEKNKKVEKSESESDNKRQQQQDEAAAKKQAAIEEAKQKEVDAELEAADEIFEETQEQSDRIVEEVKDRESKILTEEQQYYAQLADLQNDTNQAGITADEQYRKQRLAAVANSKKTEAQIVTDIEADKKQKEVDFQNARLKDQILYGEKSAAISDALRRAEYLTQEYEFGKYAQMIDSENEETKNIAKAAAITQMGISTAQSALQSYNSVAWIPYVGIPLGIGLAAVVAGYGLGKINEIRAMKTGGIVPGVGDQDTVPAILTPGELVIPKKETQELIKAMNGRKMADGGLTSRNDATGESQNSDLLNSFNDLFSVPGIFLALLGMNGGDDETNATGSAAEEMAKIPGKIMGKFEEAADELLYVFLSALPGGEIIYELKKALDMPVDEIKELLGDNVVIDFLSDIDSELQRVIVSELQTFGGAFVGLIGGIGSTAEDFIKGIAGAFGFADGGIVGMTTPGEMRVSQDALKALAYGANTSNNNTMTIKNVGGGSSSQQPVQKQVFELVMNDNLAEFVTVKQREGKNLNTMTNPWE